MGGGLGEGTHGTPGRGQRGGGMTFTGDINPEVTMSTVTAGDQISFDTRDQLS